MEPFVGQISLFASEAAPRGWALCHGQLLSITENQPLFSLLGTTYGGDGMSTFALPDLRGRAAAGVGQGPGLPDMQLGETGIYPSVAAPTATSANTEGVPYLGMSWCIAINGVFPSKT